MKTNENGANTQAKKSNTLKKVLLTVTAVLGALIVIAGSYVLYVVLSYSRIEDNLALTVDSQKTALAQRGTPYKASTFNIGFGAYNHAFSFFMDTGTMKDGTAVEGKYAKARSRSVVVENTNGAIASAAALDADFLFFQEVDTDSTRSRGVNQLDMLKDGFAAYSSVFASNYHSAYLLYPFSDPIGKSNSGIVTFSKYKTDSVVRRTLPLSTGFDKFFDLDRCIMISRLPVSGGGELVLINVHLSAYDAGGTIRQQQVALLKEILQAERDAGNYVVMGGDFNHDIANSVDTFATQQKKPEWVYTFSAADLPEGYSFATNANAPTCRSTDMPYTKGINYTVVIDGFIVSDNVTVNAVTNIDLNFVNSDHNPVLLEFILV